MVTTDSGPSGARVVARCDHLGGGRFSDSTTGLYRPYLGPAHRAAIDTVAGWMTAAGMTTRIDAAANLIGRFEGRRPGLPCLMIGSHLDSVTDAGRYDGPLGVMLGIDCVATLAARPGERLPFAVEVIAFGDEEGSRFPASMLCSRAVAGTLDPAATAMTGRDGVTLAAALAGFGRSVERLGDAAYAAGAVVVYLEAHIEQGPVLEAEDRAIGVVTGIAAQKRYDVTLHGRAGHAGTTSMPLRRDALVAAAEVVLAVERIAAAAAKRDAGVVATVGRLTVAPGATNVIPGRVDFTVDVRAGSDGVRDEVAASILAAVDAVAAARGIGLSVVETQALPASPCDPALTELLAAAAAAVTQHPARRLVSGAGHDAMVMAALAPTAMLFVRCAGGVSHNPAESVDPADVAVALAAMLAFVDTLASVWNQGQA